MPRKKEYTMLHLNKFEQILKLNIGVSQSDNAKMFSILQSILPLKIHQFSSGQEHNGWVIPHDWTVKRALIKKNGRIIFNGKVHSLAVAGYSCSFKGKVNRKKLNQHIYTRPELPNAYSYQFMFTYKPWLKRWGFSVPYGIYKTWDDGIYEIDLQTQYKKGEMLVGEYFHQGRLNNTIVFNAHTCHPAQFNDDLSGVAVILELFKWLSKKKTRFSYRAILGPEHFGSHFYLNRLSPEKRKHFKMGVFVEMVGIKNRLTLQQSFHGNHYIDYIAEKALRAFEPHLRIGSFRSIVGNDETVWEAPGVEIPFVSISRCHQSPFYYKEYHTNEDNLTIASRRHLVQTLEALKTMVKCIEADQMVERTFNGLIALSNPRYNLYFQRPAPGVKRKFTQAELKLGKLQDILPRYFDGEHSVAQLADRFDINVHTMKMHIRKFAAKGLVKLR